VVIHPRIRKQKSLANAGSGEDYAGEGDSGHMNEHRKSPWFHGIVVSIVLTVLSPLIGRHASTNALLSIIKEAGSPEGVNVAHLNQAISTAQSAWVISLVLSSIASVALVVCLIGYIKEQRKSNQR
jgi:hypothetical protein